MANGGVAGILTLSLLAPSRRVWVCTGGQTAWPGPWSLMPPYFVPHSPPLSLQDG